MVREQPSYRPLLWYLLLIHAIFTPNVSTYGLEVVLLIKVLYTCADSDDSVSSSLSRRPGNLEDVKAALVADLASNGIRRLSDRMPMERQLVIFLHENVERPEEWIWKGSNFWFGNE